MSLFKGRDDVYAKRWESKQKEKLGYSPSCLNEWRSGVCAKPRGTCAGCTDKAYAALDEKVIQDHLLGKVAGIYPMRCLPQRGDANGSLIATSSPVSGRLTAVTVPPCRVTILSVIARPMPVPPLCRSRASATR